MKDAVSEVERESLRARVSLLEERIALTREIEVQTPDSVRILFERLEELTAGWDSFAHVVDLSVAQRPSPEVRAELRVQVARFVPRLRLLAVVVENNVVMRAMARLLAYAMNIREISLHDTVPEAVEAARRAIR